MENSSTEKNRIHLLDEVRGFAVFCMVFYHGFYILSDFFGVEIAGKLFDFFTPVEPFFAGLFIIVCGISCSLSHSNLKRGLKIFGVALALSFVTIVIMPAINIDGAQIYFGILHFLGVSVLIHALIGKKTEKINPYIGIIACAMLYPFFSGIETGTLSYGEIFVLKIPEVFYNTNWLMPLGIYSKDFYSADYFPIFPSIFIFFAGVFIGRIFKEKGFPNYSYKQRVTFFGWLGKKAFIIYILHMPIIAGIAYGISSIINLIS